MAEGKLRQGGFVISAQTKSKNEKEFASRILSRIESGKVGSRQELNKLKLIIGKELGMSRLPSNPDILSQSKSVSTAAAQMLSIKPLRTLSGVAPVAIMTRPFRCPHGTCTYCPGGIGSPFGDVPQSYTGHEPATMRGMNNNYDAYLQVVNRLQQYYTTGHNPEKLELIIMGGTFPATPKDYQEEFVSGAFRAANDFSEMFFEGGEFDQKKFNAFFSGKHHYTQNPKSRLPDAQGPGNAGGRMGVEGEHARNETAKVRIVAMCIETKPDWSKEPHINEMLRLGATRVELGAQSIYNEVLKATNRGHTVEDTIEATRLLKDSGLKVTYHIMLGQPLSSREKDIAMFRELFSNPDFMPDGLKIYPCMVMPGTALARQWETGKFTPLSTEEAADIIAEAKRFFPEWTRVHRIQRDIPTKFSLAGLDKNNLRQMVEEQCKMKGIACRCIRCRESGINFGRGIVVDYDAVKMVQRKYEASVGEEVFISFEDTKNNLILGFCRLRKPAAPLRPEFTDNTCSVRELHVFGRQVGIGGHNEGSQQHRGLGIKLMERAEEVAVEEFGARKLLVISGVGAMEYYRKKLGYSREGAYMATAL